MDAAVLTCEIGERRPVAAFEALDLPEEYLVVAGTGYGHGGAFEDGGRRFDDRRAAEAVAQRDAQQALLQRAAEVVEQGSLVMGQDADRKAGE